MEDVLDVYARPFDPNRPVVCLDEKSKELHGPRRDPLSLPAGKGQREDYEYVRHGTVNLFVWVEPLAGKRNVRVTERRTSVDFAQALRLLVDAHYPEAERIVLVTDNLNTHTPACLYEAFCPEEARRIAARLEWHYTPEHGSWLNMAELELSVLSRQCLKRRMADRSFLAREVLAWERDRNAARTTIDWQFRTADARIKLKRLYPIIKEQKE
jgi:DDE superfamily endonuclease